MASIRSYVNGAGGSSGADLATLKPLYTSGQLWYLGNSVAGNSNANAGTERMKPLSTMAQAVSNASAYDTIVVLAGHAETISSNLDITKAGLRIVGEGSGSTVPRFTNNVAAATNAMWTADAKGILFDNLYFPQSAQAARERINVAGASGSVILRNLTFECGANDSSRSLRFTSGASVDHGSGLTFTAVGSGAGPAIEVSSSQIGLEMDNVTMNGGSFGWGTSGAIYGATAPVGILITNLSLLNGSDVNLPTGTTGIIQVSTQSGDSFVNWTP